MSFIAAASSTGEVNLTFNDDRPRNSPFESTRGCDHRGPLIVYFARRRRGVVVPR
jgi:hypothetical protein